MFLSILSTLNEQSRKKNESGISLFCFHSVLLKYLYVYMTFRGRYRIADQVDGPGDPNKNDSHCK